MDEVIQRCRNCLKLGTWQCEKPGCTLPAPPDSIPRYAYIRFAHGLELCWIENGRIHREKPLIDTRCQRILSKHRQKSRRHNHADAT